MGPSIASITARIEAWRPGGENLKASRLPSLGGNESGAAQGLQNLGKEALRSFRGASQRGQQGALAGGQRGQVDHHAKRIVGGPRQLHRGTGLSQLSHSVDFPVTDPKAFYELPWSLQG
jgi:hypothetical protein